jgi:regulatory protein
MAVQPFLRLIMDTVTAVKASKRGKSRLSIYLNGSFAFSLEEEVVRQHGLHPGQLLSDRELCELRKADLHHRCLGAALRLLSYRPRSEVEMRQRLGLRFEAETVDRVVSHLKERQMLDDAAFARFWKENREAFRPRSRRLLEVELRRKGVDSEVVSQALMGVDDEELAHRAAQKKGRNLEKDYDVFRRKLGAYLVRRGFSYEVTNRTVQRVWRELS